MARTYNANGIKEYVGARYVPVFYDDGHGGSEWSSAVAYEPLTVVEYQGVTYLSKQYVPAGTPITNTDYWYLTWETSTQIDEYRREVAALASSVTALDLRTDAIEDTIEVVGFKDTNALKGKTIVFFGDSWVVGGSGGDWRFTNCVSSALGMVQKNYGVGGAGFTIEGNLISTQITTAINDMDADARAEVPVVVLVGGVNDLRAIATLNMGTFLTAIDTVINGIHNAFPNAVIYAGLCNSTLANFSETMINFAEQACLRASYHRSFPVVSIFGIHEWTHGISQYYIDDGLHLSVLGHSVFGEKIVNAIVGANSNASTFIAPFTYEEGITVAIPLHVWKEGANMVCTGGRVTFASTTTQIPIAWLPAGCYPKDNIYFPVYAGNSLVGNLSIIASGHVFFTPLPNSAGISGIYIPPFSWKPF